ncbi:4186_t:CDS:2 [Diversispora eburnea]|uniref:4186_t:CDS:1 n=1 Tax=Diversispora eburnea TaxID=1213867 RepID=A0A9N9FT63_9GLOM|nr:4186_t:CDS:2 [Diversispora eburnea]
MSSVTTSPSKASPSSMASFASLTDTSVSTVSTPLNIQKTEEQKKYRQFWWKTGNFHPKANWNEGFWEWKNNTVRVIEFPSPFHEGPVHTIVMKLGAVFDPVENTLAGIKACGATSREQDASFRPYGKPPVPSGGYDGGNMPWPNLIIEVVYGQSMSVLKDKIDNYWLLPNRVHDAIAIKLNYAQNNNVPTEMTAWHYCVNNRTVVGALAPVMYEFGTTDRQGNQINILPGQCVINIPLQCIYHGMLNLNIPALPLPNLISIDLFSVRNKLRKENAKLKHGKEEAETENAKLKQAWKSMKPESQI